MVFALDLGKVSVQWRLEVAGWPPLGVARRLFGMTKSHSSRLEWWPTGRNSAPLNSVNRP